MTNMGSAYDIKDDGEEDSLGDQHLALETA